MHGRDHRWVWLAASLSACVLDSKLGGVADEASTSDTGGDDGTGGSASAEATSAGSASSADGTTGGGDSGDPMTPAPTTREVDVIFVVDNSGSMAEEQLALVNGIEGFVQVLDEGDVDWRLAVTTTDNGNPWCNGTSPEGGAFRLSSCRSRLSDFFFMGAIPVDASQTGCLDVCAHESIEVLETPTAIDGTPKQRPWLERTNGQLNLPAEMPLGEALRCVVPQGLNGCGFEQHLESAYKGVKRTENADEFSYGYLRDGALLAVIFVTDEGDCSHNGNWSVIFLPMENDGNEVFWSDPNNQSSPTSAVCWNAGVTCTGSGSPWDECHAADKDVDGNLVAPELAADSAVLYPLDRYVQLLKERASYVAAIDGVPNGYSEGEQIAYQISLDPQDQLDYGIGPACESPNGKAFPSVRLREMVERVDDGERNDFSICASQGPALTTIAQRIVARLP